MNQMIPIISMLDFYSLMESCLGFENLYTLMTKQYKHLHNSTTDAQIVLNVCKDIQREVSN